MLFFLIMIGSAVFVSAFVVHVRKRAFERRFAYVLARRRRRSERGRHGGSGLFVRRLSRSISRPGTRDVEHDGDPYQHVAQSVSMVNLSDLTADDVPVMEKDISIEQGLPHGNEACTPLESQHDTTSGASERPRNDRTVTNRSGTGDEIQVHPSSNSENSPSHITFGPNTNFRAERTPTRNNHHRFLSMQGVGADSHATIKTRSQTGSSNEIPENPLDISESASNNLPFTNTGFLSRNSTFHHLSEEERQKLGGYEYRAIRLLSWLVPAYYVLFQLFGCLGIGAYVAINKPSSD